MREARRKEIAAYIARRREATMKELCAAFRVSMNTVRADVAFLEKTGTVEKVYGGVRSLARHEIPVFTHRTQIRPDAKLAIARAAARFIDAGDTLFIDAGTTTMNVLDILPRDIRLTVVTANLRVISRAAEMPNVDLIVLPGSLNRRTNSLSDVSTLEFLGRYHFIKALMAATGLSPDGKLNVSSYLECEIKQLAVSRSEQRLLLCDSGKFGAAGLLSYASLSDMDRLITDAPCPGALRSLCESGGVALSEAEQEI